MKCQLLSETLCQLHSPVFCHMEMSRPVLLYYHHSAEHTVSERKPGSSVLCIRPHYYSLTAYILPAFSMVNSYISFNIQPKSYLAEVFSVLSQAEILIVFFVWKYLVSLPGNI